MCLTLLEDKWIKWKVTKGQKLDTLCIQVAEMWILMWLVTAAGKCSDTSDFTMNSNVNLNVNYIPKSALKSIRLLKNISH